MPAPPPGRDVERNIALSNWAGAVLASSSAADAYAEVQAQQLSSTLVASGYATFGQSWSCGRVAIAYIIGYRPPMSEEQTRTEAESTIQKMRSTLVEAGLCAP